MSPGLSFAPSFLPISLVSSSFLLLSFTCHRTDNVNLTYNTDNLLVPKNREKMDILLGRITLSLFDSTEGDNKDTTLVRSYTGQVHLTEGYHVFALFHYSTAPWNAFKLGDAGKENKDELERQQKWIVEPRQFNLQYIAPGQTDPVAVPGSVFSNNNTPGLSLLKKIAGQNEDYIE